MATHKATSASPAASRTRAPQTSKAAVEGTETRESHSPSDHIVSDTAKALHGLVGLNQRTDTPLLGPIRSLSRTQLQAALRAGFRPQFNAKHADIAHLMELLATIPEFCDDEQGVFLSDLEYCRGAVATGQRVRRLAARIFRVGYFLGGMAAVTGQRQQGGAL